MRAAVAGAGIGGLTLALALHARGIEAVICEREGMSSCEPTRFALLATAVPSERGAPEWVADRVAFLIGAEFRGDADTAVALVSRIEAFSRSPERFAREYREREEALGRQVATARLLHPLIEPGPLLLTELVEKGIALNVPGNRADIFAAKAARAHAALRGSRVVEEVDLTFAVATVLAPRAMSVPDEPEPSDDPESPPMPPSPGEGEEERRESAGRGVEEGEGGPGEMEAEGMAGDASGSPDADESRLYEGIDFDAPLPKLAEFFAEEIRKRAGTAPFEAIGEPFSGDWQSEEICSANTPDLLAAVANALDQLRRGGPRWTIEENLANALARAKAQGSVS